VRILFVVLVVATGALMALVSPLYALMLYLWIAYFRPDSWVWHKSLVHYDLSFYSGVLLLARTVLSPVRFRIDLRSLLLLAFLAHAGVSTLLAVNQDYSWAYYQDFIKAAIITYLISVLASDYSRVRLIMITIAVSLSFEGAKQGWAQLVLNPGATNVNKIPFLGDNNAVAVGVLMMVPILVALARTAPSRWERWLHRFLALGMFYRGISTFSRGGFLAAVALGIVYVLRSERKFPAIAGAAIAATIVLAVMPDTFWDRMDTITVEEGEEYDGSIRGRLHFWSVAVSMARDKPFFGVGYNGFPAAYDLYDTTAAEFGMARGVHSMWMGILSELGFVGLGLFAVLLLLAWRACQLARRLAKAGRIRPELGHFGGALQAAFVVCAVGGSFVNFQYVEVLWHFLGLTMALQTLNQTAVAETASAANAASRPAPRVASLNPYGHPG
jgi:probable O-glycosylation ligase (exosortase A-associated)